MPSAYATSLICLVLLCPCALSQTPSLAGGAATLAGAQSPSALLFQDDFRDGQQWIEEFEEPGSVTYTGGMVDIIAPKGATLWFKPKLTGRIVITYEIQAVAEGGPLDRVSDLNCFWMASDPNREGDFFSPPRSGNFAAYNMLKTYYVGLGGNRNTTTRFRRYIGSPSERPLLPENDRAAPADLLQPNHWQTIRLIADAGDIRYYRDSKLLFYYRDPAPYTEGWFGLRTTLNHMRVRQLRIYRLAPGGAP